MFDVEAPNPLTDENVNRIEGLVTAYGSEEVRRLLVDWIQQASALAAADATVAMAEKAINPSKELEDQAAQDLKAIPSYREAVLEADNAVRKRVRQELTGGV